MVLRFTDEAKQQFQEKGYVIIEGVLSPEEVSTVRGIVMELADWERRKGTAFLYGEGNSLQRIWNLLNKHEVFRELIQQPLILEMMAHLFDNNYVLRSWTANIVGGGGKAGGLHIDTPLPEPIPPYILEANTMWLLDDYTETNGATMCLPGSHLLVYKPREEDQERTDLIKMLAPAGSVVLTHGSLWHKSGTNQTDRERVVLLGSFAAGYSRYLSTQEEYQLILDQEVLDQASPALKEMIGIGRGIHQGALQKPPQW
jgi:ectoine hydroxylase-related dioxygenase (phytanoyl-CoA dioxygenase family)